MRIPTPSSGNSGSGIGRCLRSRGLVTAWHSTSKRNHLKVRHGMADSGDLFGGGAARKLPPVRPHCGRSEGRRSVRQGGGQKASARGRAFGHAGRERLYRVRHRGAGGARAGAPAARHVYRRHRREGAAPPLRRGDRQRHGRGGGGPCHLHRGRSVEDGRLRHRDRQWPRHPGRSASRSSRRSPRSRSS